MSFPPGTEMFQFPGFASKPYVFRFRYLSQTLVTDRPIARTSDRQGL